jgi:hypothetical protein
VGALLFLLYTLSFLLLTSGQVSSVINFAQAQTWAQQSSINMIFLVGTEQAFYKIQRLLEKKSCYRTGLDLPVDSYRNDERLQQ